MIDVNEDGWAEEVEGACRPVIADFWAERCAPCKMMGMILTNLEKLYGDRFKFVRLNVDEAPQLASKHGIKGIPTVIIFKDGVETHRLIGVQPYQKMSQLLSTFFSEDAVRKSMSEESSKGVDITQRN